MLQAGRFAAERPDLDLWAERQIMARLVLGALCADLAALAFVACMIAGG